jgi:hypothetical protein
VIRLDEHTYCLGLWCLAGENADWIAAVTSEDGGSLTLRYRFRSHEAPDQARWWTARFPGKSEGEIVRVVDDLVADIQTGDFGAARPWRQILRGGRDRVIVALRACPFLRVEDLTSSTSPIES